MVKHTLNLLEPLPVQSAYLRVLILQDGQASRERESDLQLVILGMIAAL